VEFFEFPEPEPEPEPARERPARPPWAGPPENVLPGVVAVELVLARSELAAVCVSRLEAYETGFCLQLLALASSDREDLDPGMFAAHHRRMRGRAPGPHPPPELLRFGVQFADGRKATNTTPMPFGRGRAHMMSAHSREPEERPPGPVLTSRGGSGGDRSWRQEMWVWPLPPPGPLALVCEWPAAEIGLTRQELDAAELLAASARAQAIFPKPAGG
jgi:hypothetical protein